MTGLDFKVNLLEPSLQKKKDQDLCLFIKDEEERIRWQKSIQKINAKIKRRR